MNMIWLYVNSVLEIILPTGKPLAFVSRVTMFSSNTLHSQKCHQHNCDVLVNLHSGAGQGSIILAGVLLTIVKWKLHLICYANIQAGEMSFSS